MNYYDPNITILKKIRDTDGFPGIVSVTAQAVIVPKYATLETSPHTGIILQWHLTKKGASTLRAAIRHERMMMNLREKLRRDAQEPVAVRPLTVEVLDALKSILQDGHPNTEKLDILARIQRAGSGGMYRGQWIAEGPWAECKDGEWSLTDLGRSAAVAHVRKAECAQFGGKAR